MSYKKQAAICMIVYSMLSNCNLCYPQQNLYSNLYQLNTPQYSLEMDYTDLSNQGWNTGIQACRHSNSHRSHRKSHLGGMHNSGGNVVHEHNIKLSIENPFRSIKPLSLIKSFVKFIVLLPFRVAFAIVKLHVKLFLFVTLQLFRLLMITWLVLVISCYFCNNGGLSEEPLVIVHESHKVLENNFSEEKSFLQTFGIYFHQIKMGILSPMLVCYDIESDPEDICNISFNICVETCKEEGFNSNSAALLAQRRICLNELGSEVLNHTDFDLNVVNVNKLLATVEAGKGVLDAAKEIDSKNKQGVKNFNARDYRAFCQDQMNTDSAFLKSMCKVESLIYDYPEFFDKTDGQITFKNLEKRTNGQVVSDLNKALCFLCEVGVMDTADAKYINDLEISRLHWFYALESGNPLDMEFHMADNIVKTYDVYASTSII